MSRALRISQPSMARSFATSAIASAAVARPTKRQLQCTFQAHSFPSFLSAPVGFSSRHTYPTSSRLISMSPALPKRHLPPTGPRKRIPVATNKKVQGKILKDQVLADARPTYVSAPSVSGEDMVKAIESSRKSSEGSLESGNDPFGKGADPFANQLEAAIEASLRNTSSRNRAGRKDSRHDRASALATETKIPDLQAEYLVGPAKWESVNAKDVPIKSMYQRVIIIFGSKIMSSDPRCCFGKCRCDSKEYAKSCHIRTWIRSSSFQVWKKDCAAVPMRYTLPY